MSGLTASERLRIVMASARKSGARARGTILRLPVLRWRYGLPIADRFVLVPRDLRVADPSFVSEVTLGQLGLAGRMAHLGGKSPFEVRPPNRAWERELHGFSWLRHLQAAGSDEANKIAIDWVCAWISKNKSKRGVAWEPDVLGRRVTSWICHVPMLLEAASSQVYDKVTDSLGEQLVELSSRWREIDRGLPRLQAQIALLQAMLCVYGHDGEVNGAQDALFSELKIQILPDGGHISRNPAVTIELLLDLLPLRQCYVARQVNVPDELHGTILSLLAMVHHMRLGDGSIARFNGMGATPLDELATVLAYDFEPVIEPRPAVLEQSRYARLQAGDTIILVDGGAAPPWHVGGQAQAGCLSFEMTSARLPLFVNCGMPGPSYRSELDEARSTAAHNTLAIKGTSSGRILRSAFLQAQAGGYPIRHPANVQAAIEVAEKQISFTGVHDGYRPSHGMEHRRKLILDQDGRRLVGRDEIGAPGGTLRLAKDDPFAVHFHLHPDVDCEFERAVGGEDGEPNGLILTLANGERWKFGSPDALLFIEDSVHFAEAAGPRDSLQIVLRGASFGDSAVDWCLERLD